MSRTGLAHALACLIAVSAIGSRVVHAEPSASDAATARGLFDEARKLMKAGKYAEACPKLEEGVRLNPGVGMKFNLADCYEHIGKTASAWTLYLDVAAAAKTLKQADREKVARQRAQKLESKLSRLTIDVAPDAKVEGLEVKRNDTPIGPGQWGIAVPVDPGTYAITAHAPNHKPWDQSVEVAGDGASAKVVVPALIALPKPAPPPPIVPPPQGLGTRRTVALVLGGVSVIALGTGAFFGLRAMSLAGDARDHCTGNLCDAQGFSLRNDARGAGNVSTVAFAVGAAALAGGAVLWLTSSDPRASDHARVLPMIGFGVAGATLGGAF